jgi:hypothetical protein
MMLKGRRDIRLERRFEELLDRLLDGLRPALARRQRRRSRVEMADPGYPVRHDLQPDLGRVLDQRRRLLLHIVEVVLAP